MTCATLVATWLFSAHGIVIMFVGFTGSAFNQHETVSIGLNETANFGGYGFKVLNVNDGDTLTISSATLLSSFRERKSVDQLRRSAQL